ncbi:hypothetical protein [Nonomuraea jiangxiensis]|uniref:Alpha amylase inhibitor n=1 Tax=Nonomuraea jiangxiensis TaxID=633440 RepID=A0A1G9PDZ2_9ACTN|nr:hypothetical protein [Nonomuraea jiangxiensis]SDL96365.1 hypothetical protein SAMN05421869_133100 [Nonomuraea jiangxiensis]
MSPTAKGLVGGIAAALLLTIGSASTALASSSAPAGQVCVNAVSPPGQLCVPGTPGFTAVRATISSAYNWSSYAVVLRPAAGVSVGCIKPGDTATYPRNFELAGIQVLSSATCAV